ncbi:hypothetical protein D9M71_181020 [compost metagenome]
MLDHSQLFGLGADHEAGGVVQEQQRHVGLFAELDELRRLGRTLGRDGPVVADQAAGAAFDTQVAADGLAVELVLEVEEFRAVGDAGDDLAHVVGLLRVRRDHAQQFLGAVQRLTPFAFRARRQLRVPGQHGEDVAGQAQAVGVVLGQVLGGAGDLGVHLGATELLVGGDLSGGGLEQGRAGEEHLGLAAHHHHVVRQAGLVGPASGAGAMHDGDLWQAHGGHARLVGEAARALDEDVGGVVEVGAAAFGQGHHRQFVLEGDLLHPQGLLQAGGGDGAALDCAVVGDHQTANAGDVADAGDDAATGLATVLVVVQLVAGQGGQFEERRAGIEQQVDAFTRQQLAALLELGLGFLRLVQHLLLDVAEGRYGVQHGFAVLREGFAMDIDFRLDHGHCLTPDLSVRRARRPGGNRCMTHCFSPCPASRHGCPGWRRHRCGWCCR